MKKVIDLRKEQLYIEIEKEQENRGIPQGLASLNINFNNVPSKIIERVIKSISDKIITPLLDSIDNEDEKIAKAVEFVSNKNNIFFEIHKLDPYDEEKRLLNILVSERNFSRDIIFKADDFINEQGVKLYLCDSSGSTAECVSMLNIKLKQTLSNVWHLTKYRNKKCYMSDFGIILANIYLLNELFKFSVNNTELVEFAIMNKAIEFGFATNEEELKLMKEFQDKYDISNIDIKVDKNRVNPYFKWLEKDTFNMLSNFYTIKDKITFKHLIANSCNKILLLLEYIAEENEEIANEMELKYRRYSEYALTFQTKKNIPKDTLSKMNNNKLLEWFGYVEIDGDCDLDKISELEEEFVVYMKKLSLVQNAKDHSLRFKKLGKHKASGLYFPTEKALCVDLRVPSSFTHETFHMIDYTRGLGKKLSDLYNFRHIVSSYKTLVTNAIYDLDISDMTRIEFCGKNKYNRNYYFTMTEIFARCGEIYVSKILNIHNSLIGECDDIYYPMDESFLRLIKVYFDNLFKSLEI